eukprot:scaffold1409_cov245-Pinguiococcus_pyrenoidosus.AAC.10
MSFSGARRKGSGGLSSSSPRGPLSTAPSFPLVFVRRNIRTRMRTLSPGRSRTRATTPSWRSLFRSQRTVSRSETTSTTRFILFNLKDLFHGRSSSLVHDCINQTSSCAADDDSRC